MNEQMKQFGSVQPRTRTRRGLTQVEVLVASTLLLVTIGLMSSLGYRLQRIASDAKHYQMGVHELANQLDRLTAIPREELAAALEGLRVSELTAEGLTGAELQSDIVEDEWGTRLVLSLQWERVGDPVPMQMVGWIDTLPKGAKSANEAMSPPSSIKPFEAVGGLEQSEREGGAS
jgi:hypothetical protein